MPDDMVEYARRKAYGEPVRESDTDIQFTRSLEKETVPHIERIPTDSPLSRQIPAFQRGDCVSVYPDNLIGIVIKPADNNGNVLVQIKKEKQIFNHKRLKLKIPASALYPDDYDFSVIFDTVANRKARHQMKKGHFEGYQVNVIDY